MRAYTKSALQCLEKSQMMKVHDLHISSKRSDVYREGFIDPYEKKLLVSGMGFAGQLQQTSKEEQLKMIRRMFSGTNQDLSTVRINVHKERLCDETRRVSCLSGSVNENSGEVPYSCRYSRVDSKRVDRPAMVYVHGGGWVAGSAGQMENICKLVAELADAVVWNVEYTLAPEGKYPTAFEEIWSLLRHIFSNAQKYGIASDKIMIAGDSAGANLAAVITLRDRNEHTHMIAGQYLHYPVLMVGNRFPDDFEWNQNAFSIHDEEKELIYPRIKMGQPEFNYEATGDMIPMFASYYLSKAEEGEVPYVSPMLEKDLSGLPPTYIATAEYDGLRFQGEYFAKRLKDAKIPVRLIRYCGCFHSYLAKLGVIPQAEDACREMAKVLSLEMV